MIKPNIAESRFGVDGADADATNFTAPSSGQRDTGWVLNQIPTSSVATYLENKTYRWLQFLDEVFKVAGTAVADFKLTGAMSVTGTLTAGGALTVSSGGAAITGTLAVTGAATVSTTLGVTGSATVGGTLGVTGVLTPSGGIAAHAVSGDVTVSGRVIATGASASLDLFETTASAQRIRLQAPAALSADFTLTLPSALPAARAAVTVSATGQLGFDATPDLYNIASAVPATGASFLIAGGLAPTLILGGTGSPCPVIVSVGDTITAWSADFVKNSNATVTVTATLLKCVGISVTTIGVAQTNSANAPGSITLGQSGLSAVVASGESYVILVQSSSGSDDAVTSYSLTR
jgi:fibronectin-binding autotransporter adhesin